MFRKGLYNLNSTIVKIALSLLVLGLLVKGFIDFSTKFEIEVFFNSLNSTLYLFILMALLVPNLYCEGMKWQSLVSFRIELSLLYRAILGGYSSALISPNRTGEFVGRVSFFPSFQRTELAASTFAGSLIQGMVTISFGLIGIVTIPFELDVISTRGLIIYITTGMILILVSVILLRKNSKIKMEFYRIIDTLKSLKTASILNAFFWAVLRYITFTFQFYLALKLFNFQGSLSYALAGISVMYLLQSYVPLTSVGELGVREFLSLVLFGNFMPHSFMAVFPAFLIWIINIVIPSLSGWWFLRNQRIPEFVK